MVLALLSFEVFFSYYWIFLYLCYVNLNLFELVFQTFGYRIFEGFLLICRIFIPRIPWSKKIFFLFCLIFVNKITLFYSSCFHYFPNFCYKYHFLRQFFSFFSDFFLSILLYVNFVVCYSQRSFFLSFFGFFTWVTLIWKDYCLIFLWFLQVVTARVYLFICFNLLYAGSDCYFHIRSWSLLMIFSFGFSEPLHLLTLLHYFFPVLRTFIFHEFALWH